jgi:hypothetical protein
MDGGVLGPDTFISGVNLIYITRPCKKNSCLQSLGGENQLEWKAENIIYSIYFCVRENNNKNTSSVSVQENYNRFTSLKNENSQDSLLGNLLGSFQNKIESQKCL